MHTHTYTHIHSTHSHKYIHCLPYRTIKVELLLILLPSVFSIIFYLTCVLLVIFWVYFLRSEPTLASWRRFSKIFLEDSQPMCQKMKRSQGSDSSLNPSRMLWIEEPLPFSSGSLPGLLCVCVWYRALWSESVDFSKKQKAFMQKNRKNSHF